MGSRGGAARGRPRSREELARGDVVEEGLVGGGGGGMELVDDGWMRQVVPVVSLAASVVDIWTAPMMACFAASRVVHR